MARRSLCKRWGYNALRVICRLLGVLLFRIRCFGREHIPARGGVLVCSNHQSFLDPVLVGLACDRRLNYLARKSLFRVPGLSLLIRFLDAIPIDRDGSGIGGLKETLKRLKQDEMVLIFPEGARTSDGEVAPLKPGFCAVARRSKVPLLPVSIDGAFHAWPRDKKLPRFARIHICFGPPITPCAISGFSDEELVQELENRLRACHQIARAGRARAGTKTQ